MRVFVSYARADVAHAEQLARFLETEGFEPVLGPGEIPPGADWRTRLGGLIRSADSVVLVLTDRCAMSEVCDWEVGEALRLGKQVLAVVPEPLDLQRAPAGMSVADAIRFYPDPAVDGSGWFDGQQRLTTALERERDRLISMTDLEAPPETQPIEDEPQQLRDELIPAARDEAEERVESPEAHEQWIDRDRPAARVPPISPSPGGYARADTDRRRMPILRLSLLVLGLLLILALITNASVRAQVGALFAEVREMWAQVAPEEEKRGAEAVSAEAYVPDREARTGNDGANVRDYPLLSGDLVAELPPRAALDITGRLNVQGHWWYRVVLEDGRVGFVREDTIRWGSRITTPDRYRVQPVGAETTALVGGQGANIRAGPSMDARRVARLEAGDRVSLTGKVRQAEYWWLRVSLSDGRSGFAREDVLVTADGERLDLSD
jgi:hypothetical protein